MCVAVITCPPLPLWSTLRANATSNTVGTSVLTTCDVTADGNPTGFLDNRSQHIVTCLEDGIWSKQVLECVMKAGAQGMDECPMEAPNGAWLGIISVGLVMMLLGVCLDNDIPEYKRSLFVLRRRLIDFVGRRF